MFIRYVDIKVERQKMYLRMIKNQKIWKIAYYPSI